MATFEERLSQRLAEQRATQEAPAEPKPDHAAQEAYERFDEELMDFGVKLQERLESVKEYDEKLETLHANGAPAEEIEQLRTEFQALLGRTQSPTTRTHRSRPSRLDRAKTWWIGLVDDGPGTKKD